MENNLKQYTAHINRSELLQDYYRSLTDKCASSLKEPLVNWALFDQSNKPLTIRSADTANLNSNIVRWLDSHRKRYKEDVVLVEYCGRIRCQELLYRLTSKLRRLLNISQKVETSDEKIRKFFPYWLELCSRTAQKLALQEGSPSDRKILLVLMDVHMVAGSENESVHPSFWLPEQLPPNIRLLMTADQNHNFMEFGRQAEYQPSYPLQQIKLMPQQALKRRMKPIQQKILTCMLTLKNKDFQQILQKQLSIGVDTATTFQDVFLQIMNFWLDKSILTQSSLQVIAVLSCCHTGLTLSEICSICCISSKQFKKLVCILPIICNFKDIFYIPEQLIKQSLRQSLTVNKKDIHAMVAKRLKPMASNLRKLLEEAYHLLHGCCFFELKQLISRADSFLILYNWQTKFELFHMWKQLESECHFDPVFEYNRALTSYQLHCYPSDDSLFKLLVQLSRFFIEYADFQMFGVPIFKHPLIKGTEGALNRMHLLQQLKKREMLLKKQKVSTNSEPERSIKSLIEKVVADLEAGKPIGPICQPIKSESLQYAPQPREIVETMNVEIVNNRNKFQKYYINKLEPYISILREKSNSSHHHLHNPLDEADYGAYEQEMFDIAMEEPSYYYYRQWLWIQLPWLSLTLEHDFSQMIRGCMEAGSIGYMSVQEEDQLSQQAAAISLESYLKKFDGGRITMALKITKETSRRAKSKVTEIEETVTNRESKMPTEIKCEAKKPNKGTMSIGKLGTFITGVDQECREPLPEIKTQRQRNVPDSLTLKRQLNSYTYENKVLVKKLQALQLRQQTTQRSLEETRNLHILQASIESFKQKCKEQRYQLAKSIVYQDKLNTIINICVENAVHNTECTSPMQRYVSNLKIMIEVAKEALKKQKEEFRLFQHKMKKSHHTTNITTRVIKLSKHDIKEEYVETECNRSIDSMITEMYERNPSVNNSIVEEAPPAVKAISIDSPEFKKFLEVCSKRQELQQRTIELQTNKENIQKNIKQLQLKIKAQNLGCKSLPTTKRISVDKSAEMKKQLQMLRLRKAQLALFVETVQPAIQQAFTIKNA